MQRLSHAPVVVCVGARCQNVTTTSSEPLFPTTDAWIDALPPLEAGGTCANRALQKSHEICRDRKTLNLTLSDRKCPQCAMPALLNASFRLRMADAVRPVRWTELVKQRMLQRGRLRTLREASVPQLSCSSSRGADRVVLSSFFSDSNGVPLAPAGGGVGHFLEIGGYDGYHATNTWYFERCLGWRGVLVEPDRGQFSRLRANRPYTLNVNAALCTEHTAVVLDGAQSKTRVKEKVNASEEWMSQPRTVACGPLGDYLRLLSVARVDFFSLDVEGAEANALKSLNASRARHAISFGVVLVEARLPTHHGMLVGVVRTREMLLGLGLVFAGQVAHAATGEYNGDARYENQPVDEVWVNETHLRRFFPRSAALVDVVRP